MFGKLIDWLSNWVNGVFASRESFLRAHRRSPFSLEALGGSSFSGGNAWGPANAPSCLSLEALVRSCLRPTLSAAASRVLSVEALEVRCLPAQCVWWVATGTTGNWENPASWLDGQIPGPNDEVVFTANRSGNCVINGNVFIASLQMPFGNESDLILNGSLQVWEEFKKEGIGNIKQPNGMNSALYLSGQSLWNRGSINDTTTLSAVRVTAGTFEVVTGGTADFVLGSTLDIYPGATVKFDTSDAALILKNGAGIFNQGTLDLSGVNGVEASGTTIGVISNAGTIKGGSGVTLEYFPLDLPIMNLAPTSQLLVTGHLWVKGVNPANNVSVFQANGLTRVYAGKELRVEGGYTQYGGTLSTWGDGTATIKGDVKIHQNAQGPASVVVVAADAGGNYGTLWITGSLTMDGGTLRLGVRFPDLSHDRILCGGAVTLGGTAGLEVYTDGVVQTGKTFDLIAASAISGDFAWFNFWGESYTTSLSPDQKLYQLKS